MRYFFHVSDAQGLIPDEEGSDLPDSAAAHAEARANARDLAMDSLRGGPPMSDRRIVVMDETGALMETLLVRDILH